MWIMEAADNIYLKNYELLTQSEPGSATSDRDPVGPAREEGETCGEHVPHLTACLERIGRKCRMAMEGPPAP